MSPKMPCARGGSEQDTPYVLGTFIYLEGRSWVTSKSVCDTVGQGITSVAIEVILDPSVRSRFGPAGDR